MATTKTIQATVKNRTDTAANWTQKNPVLAEGEIIVVQTSAGETRLKIGDGVKTFTQLPYTDEQIYNNVVTSVNGQTGDITTNSVEYTPQTLTDEQKKQARENVGAEEVDNGLLKKTNISPLGGTIQTYYQTKESCDLKPFNAADADLKNSYFIVLGLASGTFTIREETDINKYVITPILALWKKGYFTGEIFNSFKTPLKEYSLLVRHLTGKSGDRLWINVQNKLAGCDMEINTETGAPYQYYQNFNKQIYAFTDDYSKEATAQQFSMKAAPTEDMQVATKKYVDDNKTTNAVLYTAQTLTDEQKKQVRDNIEVADADFVITATVTDNDNCTTDKTYTQIQEAVQAGKKVVVKISAYGFDFVLPLIGKFESDYMFTAVLNLTNTVVMQFAVVIGEQGNGIAKCRIPTYNSDGNKLEQVEMAAAPTADMEIATKKYIDDKISDKELILSSSTAGSTKKFKLTIDDTGTLTASEITA